jgi:hypothetical protein
MPESSQLIEALNNDEPIEAFKNAYALKEKITIEDTIQKPVKAKITSEVIYIPNDGTKNLKPKDIFHQSRKVRLNQNSKLGRAILRKVK